MLEDILDTSPKEYGRTNLAGRLDSLESTDEDDEPSGGEYQHHSPHDLTRLLDGRRDIQGVAVPEVRGGTRNVTFVDNCVREREQQAALLAEHATATGCLV